MEFACEPDWLEAVSAAADGELEPGESERLRGHLAQCETCSTLLHTYETQRRRLRFERPRAPAGLASRVLASAGIRNHRNHRARRRMLATAAAVIVADAASKAWAAASLDEPVELVGSLSLQLGYNPGVAFGVGDSLPSWVLLVFTGAICAGIAWGGWTGALHPPVAAGLIIGGAVGNLADRATGGSVVDMIHLTWWPTFNLADVAICVGAALLVVGSFRTPPEPDDGATPVPS